MIHFIEGTLVEKKPVYAVIETGGIGYFMNISLNTYTRLGEPGTKCRLLTYMAIKNEAATPVGVTLYGFYSAEERDMYINLISVNGVGANTARLILSSLTTGEIVSAIANGQVATFEKVKGIGTKTAQKIIIDLKNKYSKLALEQDVVVGVNNNNKQEALAGLMILGFNKNIAEKAIDKILRSDPSIDAVEELIKQALKIL
ncbi:MAG TPA: Holliday junction branch migration protein RuvA [Bacteroidales bacterium]|nr:Holliday junction branch migration protein RuvA [Bacteroidales bacterium]